MTGKALPSQEDRLVTGHDRLRKAQDIIAPFRTKVRRSCVTCPGPWQPTELLEPFGPGDRADGK